MTPAEFLERHPEFESAPTALIQKHLDDSELYTADTWGTQRDMVVALKTADSLARSPKGRNARMKDAETTYGHKLKRLERAHNFARFRVC